MADYQHPDFKGFPVARPRLPCRLLSVAPCRFGVLYVRSPVEDYVHVCTSTLITFPHKGLWIAVRRASGRVVDLMASNRRVNDCPHTLSVSPRGTDASVYFAKGFVIL